jgi:glycyl-tRNA synthetase beta chain
MLTALSNANIPFESDTVTVMYTYRRISIRIATMGSTQLDQEIRRLGPPLSASKTPEGHWNNAALGFAKKCGVDVDSLAISQDEKGRDVLVYHAICNGQPVLTVLGPLIAQVIYNLHLPIAMRWGSETQPFFRPVHWICCLCDGDVVPVAVWDVRSGNVTHGHRVLSGSNQADHGISGVPITIAAPAEYESRLYRHCVMVDPDKRRSVILDALQENGQDQDDISQSLCDEVIGLLEWPTPLRISFDSRFLELPSELLVQVMQTHQKYFPLWQSRSASSDAATRLSHPIQLSTQCLVIADNVTPHNQETIRLGNQRVLRARLNDAFFFWESDQTKPLDTFVKKLNDVVFQTGLGSMFNKTKRIQQLSCRLSTSLNLGIDLSQLDRAAYLCKADLVTQLVYEFPELQGVAGSVYARRTESQEICDAIYAHYLPLQPTGALPTGSVLGALISLSDRMDTIVACYVNDLIPTSSKDPYGVRRAMLGILAIINAFSWHINIDEWVSWAYEAFGKDEKNKSLLIEFFMARIKHFMTTQGIRYDVADAVSGTAVMNCVAAISKAKAIMQGIESSTSAVEAPFARLVESGLRCLKLASHLELSHFSAPLSTVDPKLFQDEREHRLFDSMNRVSQSPDLNQLQYLVPFIDQYFESVLVMAEDMSIRQNRLRLIQSVACYFNAFASLDRLVISSKGGV